MSNVTVTDEKLAELDAAVSRLENRFAELDAQIAELTALAARIKAERETRDAS